MNTKENLTKWLRDMKYNGKIPESLGNICTPSTAFIWEQIMKHAKPKDEIDLIRKNIIINRLKTNKGNENYPVKEIQLYERKKLLEERLSQIRKENEKREEELEKLSFENKISSYQDEILMKKTDGNRQKTDMYRLKEKQLKNDKRKISKNLEDLQGTLIHNKEGDENVEEIKKVLNEAVEKVSKKLTNDISSMQKSKNSIINESLGLLSDQFLSVSLNDMLCGESFVSKQSPPASSYKEKDENISNISSLLEGVLKSNNNKIVANCVTYLMEESLNKIDKTLITIKDLKRLHKGRLLEQSKFPFVEQYYSHIKMQLEFIKYQKINQNLKDSIRKKSGETQGIRNISGINEIEKSFKKDNKKTIWIKVQLFEVKSLKDAIKGVICSEKSHINLKDEPAYVTKIMEMQHKISEEQWKIQNLVNVRVKSICEDFKNISQNFDCFKKTVKLYTSDISWARELTLKVVSKEIARFKEFPLDFNKKTVFSNGSFNYNDHPNYISSDTDLESDSDCLFIISTIKNNYSRENAIIKLLKMKKELDTLIEVNKSPRISKKCTDFKFAENDEEIIRGFNAIKSSSKFSKTFKLTKMVQEILNLWETIPFGDYISTDILVDEHNYKYYEKLYDCFLDCD